MEIDMLRFFSKDEIDKLAKETSLVKRDSPITGMKFILTFTTGLLSVPDGTLAQLAGFLSCACKTRVTAQAIDERISTEATEFMRQCLAKALTMSRRPLEFDEGVLCNFDHVYVIDSTNFELHPSLSNTYKGNSGSASKASMRIQLVLDYLKGTIHIKIGDVKLADATALYDFVNSHDLDTTGKCLYLSDLGYFKTATFKKITESENQFYISKLKFRIGIKDKNEQELELQELLKKKPDIFDMTVTIGELTCRLTGKRLPEDIVNQKIRKANEASERKGGITDAYKLFLHYAIYITNLPTEYGIDVLFTLYRIRWRIELVFKTWKSILSIHKIRSSKEDRVLCEVYGKLIVAALSSMMCAAAEQFLDGVVVSLHRAMQQMRINAVSWAKAIMKGVAVHRDFIVKLKNDITRLCKKENQKTKQTIEDMLKKTVLCG